MEAGNFIESHAKYAPKLPLGPPNREHVILRGGSSDREGPEELPRASWGRQDEAQVGTQELPGPSLGLPLPRIRSAFG